MRSLVSDPSSSADGSTAGDEGGGVVSRRRVGARVDADAARAAMPPPAPRPARAPRVLDEDEWTARLDAIITRDYFPDVPALRNKLEWLEAANSGDPARVLEAQRNIQRRLRDAARGAVLDTPSLAGLTSAATGPTPSSSPSLRARSALASPSSAAARDEWEDDEAPPSSTSREDLDARVVAAADAKLGLDGFLAKYDGEDNASFREILKRQNEAKRRKMAAFYPELAGAESRDADGAAAPVVSDKALAGPGTADGVGSTALTFPREKVKNDMFFRRDGAGAALTVGERAAAARGPPKATIARNTRFETEDENPAARSSAPAPAPAPSPSPSSRAGGGYGYVATPSPAPGVDDSPFMTWGDIESTPTRLDAELPTDAGDKRFRVNPQERRERALRRLTAGTPNRTNARSATPKLSAAAKSLAKRMRGEGGGGASPARTPGGTWEGALRGAYSGATPTPGRAGWSGRTPTATPARGTPGRVASGGARATPRRPARGGDVTDDLLHL